LKRLTYFDLLASRIAYDSRQNRDDRAVFTAAILVSAAHCKHDLHVSRDQNIKFFSLNAQSLTDGKNNDCVTRFLSHGVRIK